MGVSSSGLKKNSFITFFELKMNVVNSSFILKSFKSFIEPKIFLSPKFLLSLKLSSLKIVFNNPIKPFFVAFTEYPTN